MASIQLESPRPDQKATATLTIKNNSNVPITVASNGKLSVATVQPNSKTEVPATIGQTFQVTSQDQTQNVKVMKKNEFLVIDSNKPSNHDLSSSNQAIRLYPLARNRDVTDLKSVDSQTSTYITFVNETTENVNVDWINYQGQRQRYKTLNPQESYRQQTYVTHPWEAVINGGQATQRFLPTAAGEYIAFIGRTDNPALDPLQGSEAENLRSTTNGPATSINFINYSASAANVYWINFQGGLQLYKTLTPGERYNQPTYINHPWKVVAGTTTYFQPIASEADVYIV